MVKGVVLQVDGLKDLEFRFRFRSTLKAFPIFF